MLIAWPRHLRVIPDECAAHYNGLRPHRARSLRPPDGNDILTVRLATLRRRESGRRRILGGLINEYQRAA